MEQIKFAIIGCEHAHIEIFIQEMLALGHECAGIHEPHNVQLAKSVAGKFNIPLRSDREQLLQDADIVGSSAINSEKIDLIEQCELLGKSIMVDKPAVTNRKDYERLQGVIGRNQIQIGMLLTERFHAPVYTLKKQIDQGLFGSLISIGTRKPHKLNQASRPAWFFSKEQCGGIIVDLLIHDFDLLRWLTGREIAQIDGYIAKRSLPEYPGFYDSTAVQVRMEGDVIAQLYADWYTPAKSWTWGDCRIFVTGTLGFAELRLSGDPFVKPEALMIRTTSVESPVQVELEEPPVTITEDFLKRIAGQPSIVTSQDILLASKATIDADEQARLVKPAL